MQDLVSIIVPIYNVEKYLEKCIKSILNQTYNNLEVILVDDGSPDKCPELCENIKSLDGRIKVFHKVNGGLADARNFGLRYATGKWVCFVDSDDYLKPTYVECLVTLAYKYNADIACCGYELTSEEGVPIAPVSDIETYDKCLCRESALYELLCDRIKSYAWNKLFISKLWNEEKWNTSYKVYEDNATVYKIFAKANKVAISTSRQYYYVQRRNSILHTMNLSAYIKFIEVLNEQESYVKQNEPQLVRTIPFEALRTEYIRRYVNKCIDVDQAIHIPNGLEYKKSKLNMIKEILSCNGILDKKSIFSNSLFILNRDLYCKWRKIRNMLHSI